MPVGQNITSFLLHIVSLLQTVPEIHILSSPQNVGPREQGRVWQSNANLLELPVGTR